ncbi:MAG: hypothetical protein N3F05_00825 [Candidatus Diapherotrites archaeon]|nr:hypothetical protein [Candidatus Diapherotrites archaeon]
MSDVPFIRPSKNSIIIPVDSFQKLINFFNTGENPAHRWSSKGEWKAVYYLSDKQINEQLAAKACEKVLDRQWVSSNNEKILLENFLSKLPTTRTDQNSKEIILPTCNKLISHEWFLKSYSYSERLTNFKRLCESLKGTL